MISHERLAVGAASVATPAVPAWARTAWIQADGGAVRYRLDGGDPTTSTGLALQDNQPAVVVNAPDLVAGLRFLSESGTVAVEIAYFG